MDNPVDSLLESSWKALITNAGSEILWVAYRSTPVFPSGWPPDSAAELIQYIYAYGNYSDVYRQIVDGEFISKPWARLRKPLTPGIQPVVEFLDDELHQIGIQGFRPLNAEELTIYEQAAQVEESFLNIGVTHEYRTLKVYYRTWLGLNGVIGEWIARSHTNFFEWLKSGS